MRAWVTALPRLDGPERDSAGRPVPFPRERVTFYAFRHSFAQRHADAGTPVDTLKELLGHDTVRTTLGYYRVTAKRKRAAQMLSARSRSARTPSASGRTAVPCFPPKPCASRSARSPSRSGSAPSPPTSQPTADLARSGTAASAANTSAPLGEHFRRVSDRGGTRLHALVYVLRVTVSRV